MTGDPRASRHRNRVSAPLASGDRRELELANLEVAGCVLTGDRVGVLATLRRGDDVDSRTLAVVGRMAGCLDLDGGAVQILVVELQQAIAACLCASARE